MSGGVHELMGVVPAAALPANPPLPLGEALLDPRSLSYSPTPTPLAPPPVMVPSVPHMVTPTKLQRPSIPPKPHYTPRHWQTENSVTRSRGAVQPSPAMYRTHAATPSVQQRATSQSHVEFHHSLDMDDTFVDGTESSMMQRLSRLSRASSNGEHTPSPSEVGGSPMSLPATLSWPLHAHPLRYAGTSSGNSVQICTCRNCRVEHYNTAVYSCMERACNYHICIQCALEQITAVREQEKQQQAIMRRQGPGPAAAAAGDKASPMEGKYAEEDDSVEVDPTQRVPLKASHDSKVSSANRRWMTGISASSSSLGIPLVLTTHHHPHPLLYTPMTPFQLHGSIEDKLHTHTPLLSSISADRWNCSSTSSLNCIAYQSPALRTSIPTYSCSHCAYRLCFPCLRYLYLKQSSAMADGPVHPQSQYQRVETLQLLKNNRLIDSTVQTFSEIVPSEEQLQHRQQLANYMIGFASFFAVLLLHALLLLLVSTGLASSYSQDEWSAVIVLLIFAAVAGICTKAVTRLVASQQARLAASMIRLCNYYQELDFQHLLVPQGKHTPPPTAGSLSLADALVHLKYSVKLIHLSPRQKHILQSLYHQHAEIVRYQSNTPLWSLLSLLFLIAAEGLLGAAVLLVFVVVLCRLPANVDVGSCGARLGVPIGIGVFLSLMLVHMGELLRVFWAFAYRWSRRL